MDAAILSVDQNDPISKSDYAALVERFLLDVGFKPPSRFYDLALEDEVKQHFIDQGFSPQFLKRVEQSIKCGVRMSLGTYQNTSFESQRLIGIYTSYVVIIDDFAAEMKQDLKDYKTDLLLGRPQKNQLLGAFRKFLPEIKPAFGHYGGDMIIKDAHQFIAVSYIEADGEKYLRFPVEAPEFPQFLRMKTGIAEAFAFLAFPEHMFPECQYLSRYMPAIGYMGLYVNIVNDLLSFYKEMDGGENHNFVSNYASSHGLTLAQSLEKVRAQAIDAAQHIRAIGKCDRRLGEHLESFIQGFLVFQLTLRRYRLGELDIPSAMEARKWIIRKGAGGTGKSKDDDRRSEVLRGLLFTFLLFGCVMLVIITCLSFGYFPGSSLEWTYRDSGGVLWHIH